MDCLVDEAEIDGIILAGGGAQMYGIKELFMGTLPTDDDPFDFKKIKENNKLLVTLDKYSSGICALGNVLPKSKIPYKKHCLSKYILTCALYTTDAGSNSNDLFIKALDEDPTIPDNYDLAIEAGWIIADKGTPLPVKNLTCTFDRNIKVEPGKVIVRVLKVQSVKDKVSNFQRGWQSIYRRSPNTVWQQNFDGTYIPEREVKMNVDVDISENMLIEMRPNLNIRGFWNFFNGNRVDVLV